MTVKGERQTSGYLDLEQLPRFLTADLRTFLPGEQHVNRTVGFDVLLFVMKGELVFYEAGKRVVVGPGQWYIQKAGLFQEGREASGEPVYYYIHFHGRYTLQREKGLPLSGTAGIEETKSLLRRLCRAQQGQWEAMLECHGLFYTVLSHLSRTVRAQGHGYETISRVEQYIAENYTQELPLTMLSGLFGLSADHLIRLFRRELGVTPYQYLLRLRFEQACRLLLSTDKTLEAIAEEAGYGDPSTLYRAFMRNTGYSPSSWKKKQVRGKATG